jgi:hypothetical protein
MYCAGTAVIAAKATKYRDGHFLRPIRVPRFYLPQTDAEREEHQLVVRGAKQFVTTAAMLILMSSRPRRVPPAPRTLLRLGNVVHRKAAEGLAVS